MCSRRAGASRQQAVAESSGDRADLCNFRKVRPVKPALAVQARQQGWPCGRHACRSSDAIQVVQQLDRKTRWGPTKGAAPLPLQRQRRLADMHGTPAQFATAFDPTIVLICACPALRADAICCVCGLAMACMQHALLRHGAHRSLTQKGLQQQTKNQYCSMVRQCSLSPAWAW